MTRSSISISRLLSYVVLLLLATGSAAFGWATAQLLNDPSDIAAKSAVLYASKDGGFHVVYVNTKPSWQIVYRRYQNGILTPKKVVRENFVPNPSICEAGNGDIHLVWEDWIGGPSVGWAKSSDGGQTFTWQRMTDTVETKLPMLAHYGASDSGTVVMTYWNAADKNLYWRTFNGSNWGTLYNMGQNADNIYELSGICRSLQDGTVYKSYGTNVGGVLSVCYRRFNGVNWEPQVVVASVGFFARPDIAVNTTGHILLVWDQDERIWIRMFTPGVGWGPIQQMTNEKSACPAVCAIPGTTDFYLVYTKSDRIWGRRWQGGVWQAEELVSVGKNPSFVWGPDVCAGPDGSLYASWETWETGEPQQWFSYKLGGPPPDATVWGYVRDQFGQGIAGASVASGPYTTVSQSSGYYSMRVASGTRTFSANKLGYTGQTIENVVVPPNGTVNVNFTITAIPPSPPSGFVAMPSDGLVRLSWTNPPQAWFQGTMIRFKTTGYPTSPTDGTLVCNRVGSPGQSDSFTHTGLTNGVTYYYSAFAYDVDNHYSTVAHASAKPVRATISYVKNLPDNWLIDVYSKVVSASFLPTENYIYIMEPDGSSGIRVVTNQSGYVPGDVVNVSGKMSTQYYNGYPSERIITDATITKVSSQPAPKPRAMSCRSVGGGPMGSMVPGVRNGVGVNNIGLLVRIAGKVTFKFGNYIYVDDGSRVENLYSLDTPKIGVMVRCPGSPDFSEGDVVGVTGIVQGSIPNNPAWTTNRAFIRARSWSDIVGYKVTPTLGQIAGTVKGPNGSPISGANVVTNPSNYSATTDSSGYYQINAVAPGTYTVTASKGGYVSSSQPGVVVNAGQTTTVNFTLQPSVGTISGTVTASGGGGLSGVTITTSPGGYTTTSGSGGAYTLSNVPSGTYSVTASKTGYNSDTKNNVVVNTNQTTTVNFTLTPAPVERVVNGNMEGGFYNTGWGPDCSGRTSQLPNPSGTSGWGWNNEWGVPFNTWASTGVKRGNYALGFSFCQTAPSPGRIGIAFQSVNLGAPGATATFSAWGYHTDGNCPTIMCWNPGPGQADPMVAYNNGRYQWITTDNWGQRNMWINRTMQVTADSSGYVTIMVGGAAHPGTANGAALYIDDVSVIN